MGDELAKVKPTKSFKFIDVKKVRNNEIVDVLEEVILLKYKIKDNSNYSTKNLDDYTKKLKDEINRRLENNKVFKINMGIGD